MISQKKSRSHSLDLRKGSKKVIVKHTSHHAPSAVSSKPVYKKPLAIGRYDRGYFLLVRETSDLGHHELLLIRSSDGEKFSAEPEKVTIHYEDKTKEDISKCRNFHFFCHDDDAVLTYTRFEGQSASLVYAVSRDMKNWIVGGVIKKIHANGLLVPELVDDAGDTVYFGGDVLRAAVSKGVSQSSKSASKKAKKWEMVEPHRVPHWHFYDGATFRIVAALPVDDKIAVFYESEVVVDILTDNSLNDQKVGEERFIKMGVAFFSQKDTTRLLWQSELPLIELPLEKFGNLSMLGVVRVDKKDKKEKVLRIYSASASGAVNFIEFEEGIIEEHRSGKQLGLKKHPNNPLLKPTEHEWEKEGSFNPTALVLDGKVHLFYRAVGADGLSRIGYAMSKDGVSIAERLKKPVYSLQNKASENDRDPALLADSLFHSGGSWGGSEDPKVTRIDDRIYLTYVAHNGTWPTRTAITSISTEDFLKKRWKWKKPMLMSAPNVGSKSVVILPEKVNGKFVVFHRVWPDIIVDMVPSLEFGEGKQWLGKTSRIAPRHSYWDSRKLSMGAAPIKTPQGWLAIYNAVDKRDSSKYKIGAMLLDLKDPTKVIARSRNPILSPDEWYENDGKAGVAYPGGAVDLDGILHVYYGGADKVGCVATVSIKELVQSLLKGSLPLVNFSPCSI